MNSHTNDLINLIANIALTLSLIVAIIFGLAQVRSSSRDRRERLTVETMRHFQTREFAELLYHSHNAKVPANNEEWNTWPKDDQVRFIQMSQEMESLGLLLAERLINIDLVDKTLGTFVTGTWHRCKPLILSMRDRDPYMNEYFQWMAEQMEQRMKEKPRLPFYQSAKTAI